MPDSALRMSSDTVVPKERVNFNRVRKVTFLAPRSTSQMYVRCRSHNSPKAIWDNSRVFRTWRMALPNAVSSLFAVCSCDIGGALYCSRFGSAGCGSPCEPLPPQPSLLFNARLTSNAIMPDPRNHHRSVVEISTHACLSVLASRFIATKRRNS
jgi:hypothetical protein